VSSSGWVVSRKMANNLYSIWIFLLLGAEAIKTYRSNPFIEYVDHSPTANLSDQSLTA
jgi:hypothetical protein